ncbi:Uncharacterised protein [Weissella viridescens]|uniref:Uncharacterized protein n=1 Tax=Weissella viridescens TaxID=1629 RepID=A0A380P861_WEIVI|nr:Uncharacterised protein [Weissella viridescens]
MSQKIFEALIELANDFGSGNDLQHNTKLTRFIVVQSIMLTKMN